MIEVDHLTKYYGPNPVVRDVSFNVEKGEILGFLGPNGAGKTTTMRIITGYLPPTSGSVRVAGFDVSEKSLEARRHLGYLPETVPLYTELTPYEYLDFRGRITGILNGRERKSRIFEMLDELNLGDVADKQIGQLSRGYRQRVGLAQALLHNPDALILDEPTVGLDPVQITEVRDLIKELGRNHTVILSTHLLPEVSMVCNRVVIINRGRLVALDTPINLAEGTSQTRTLELEIGGSPSAVLAALQATPGIASAQLMKSGATAGNALLDANSDGTGETLADGVYSYQIEEQPDKDLRAELASAVVGAGYRLYELKSVKPSLEEIFINVISREEEGDDEEIEVDEEGTMDEEEALLDEELDLSQNAVDQERVEAVPITRLQAKKRVRR